MGLGTHQSLSPFHTAAGACVLLATKVTNDSTIKTRDVINVIYSLLHPEKPPLNLNELYYSIRDGLIEMELLVARLLRYRFDYEHPHQDLVLILAMLRDFFPTQFSLHPKVDVASGALLRDLYSHPRLVDDHKPKTIALMVVSMAAEGLQLGISDEEWVCAIQPAMDMRRLRELKKKVAHILYDDNQ